MSPIPVVFGDCAGWFHPAANPTGRAAVLCGADGHEGLCAHRPWRGLAVRLAAAGIPALRFDPPGMGDSGGPEESPPDLHAWADSVVAAVAEARRLTGAAEVSLIGLRLGATAAALAAARLPPAPMALLFPVLSGRAHARGLTGRAAATAAGLEVGGYPWSEAALAALARFDAGETLRKAGTCPVLILTRPEAMGAAREVARALPKACALPAEAEGYGPLFAEAHAAEAPEKAFAAIVSFLRADAPAPTGIAGALPNGLLRLPNGVTERAVRFGPDGALVGAWTEPSGGAKPGSPALLLPGTGAVHHSGHGRLLVAMARRAAAAGWPVLRYDATGVGESENPDGTPLVRLLYQPGTVADARAAADWLADQGHTHVTAAGICAGGWVALQAALADRRVTHALPVNVPVLSWRDGRVLTAPARRRRERAGGLRWEMLRDAWRAGAAWPELLRVLTPGAVRATWRGTVVRGLAALGRLMPLDFGPARVSGWMRDLSARGARVTLVCSDQGPGLDELETHFGARGRHLGAIPGMRAAFLPGADHVLSTRPMRAAWLDRFLTLLGPPRLAPEAARLRTPVSRGAPAPQPAASQAATASAA